jgi:cytochrome b561
MIDWPDNGPAIRRRHGKRKLPGADRDGGYGWISIVLHWLAGIAIIVLLFAGDSIGTAGEPARRVHTTIASCAWLVLAARIVWRLMEGHPPPASGQGRLSYGAGVAVHYALLAGIALMLVSGPLAGWSSGGGIDVFDLRIPGAEPRLPGLYALARETHIVGAVVLAVGTAAHVAGVLKHMFFDRDNLFDRIMVPPKRRAET